MSKVALEVLATILDEREAWHEDHRHALAEEIFKGDFAAYCARRGGCGFFAVLHDEQVLSYGDGKHRVTRLHLPLDAPNYKHLQNGVKVRVTALAIPATDAYAPSPFVFEIAEIRPMHGVFYEPWATAQHDMLFVREEAGSTLIITEADIFVAPKVKTSEKFLSGLMTQLALVAAMAKNMGSTLTTFVRGRGAWPKNVLANRMGSYRP